MNRQNRTDTRRKGWADVLLSLVIALALIGGAGAEQSETVTYYHSDGLGSVIAASDESGNLLWRERYRPFGERLQSAVSTDEHALYYTGKPHDDDTGLTYFGARYYDPVVGRFMGIDPVGVEPGNPHSFNRYGYANNNPYRYVDPDGELAFTAGLLVYAAVKAWDVYDAYDAVTDPGVGSVEAAFAVAAVLDPSGISGKARAAKRASALVNKATKSLGQVDSAARAAPEPNRIYSARELIRRADEPGPFHNFPESFNNQIFKQGERLAISYKYIQYGLKGSLNGRSGTYEIGVKPSASGRTEVITQCH